MQEGWGGTTSYLRLAMSQSPELAGGEGFTFEGEAAAYYMAALLSESYAPGIDDRIVVRVAVQQRDFGEPLDDVIVDFADAEKNLARLSLQVKRTLTISSAKTNKDFRDVIRDSWRTLNKPDFRVGTDRYGAAVGTVTASKERALKTLCDWARESLTTAHFDSRFAIGGSAGTGIREVKDDVASLLEKAKGTPCTCEEVHRFLAHFVLIQFDFLREGSTDPVEAINRIKECLAPIESTKAPLVWSRVVHLARASAGKSGEFDRARLVRIVAPVARLRGATSLRNDLDRISAVASSYLSLIPDDVGGTRLDRRQLQESLDASLASARFVQVQGLPGSGKSVLVRRAVQRALELGPALFLKAEQLEGTSWIAYASTLGLSGVSLESLLVEIGAAGSPILFVDAIDRVEKEHQPIVIDVIRTLLDSVLLDNWRIVVSLRDSGIEMLRNWLGSHINALSVKSVSVGKLTDDDAEVLRAAKPQLGGLLFGAGPVQEIVRRPFFAKVLNQLVVTGTDDASFAPKSEIDLIEHWWRRGGYNETGQSAVDRQRALIGLARARARNLSQPIGLRQLSSVEKIEDLRSDGVLQNAREGISVRFAHDIFFEWAFFYVLVEQGSQWMDEIKACGEPPAVSRVVELLSQWEYAYGTDWQAFLHQAGRSDLRSQWLRAWLFGALGTEKFEADDGPFVKAVFIDDFSLFRKSLVWFQAERTKPNTAILASADFGEQRIRLADSLGWPSDFIPWRRLINFILKHISSIPQRLYPEIVDIFEVWQNALGEHRNNTSHTLLKQCATWLNAIDATSVLDRSNDRSQFWTQVPNLTDLQKSLARLVLRASPVERTFATEYLQRVIDSERIRRDAFMDIIAYSPVLARSLPTLLVDLSLAYFKEELPDDQVARQHQEFQRRAERRKAAQSKPESERTRLDNMALVDYSILGSGNFNLHDWDRLSINGDLGGFFPPSPLREPFRSLFKFSPDEALRLHRELCNHAMTAWQQLHNHSFDRSGTPIPLELAFPWQKQQFWGAEREYLWSRSTWAPKAIGCSFLALEEWCIDELRDGRSADELIQQVVTGNECIGVLGTAAMITLHSSVVSETTMTLICSQLLLMADHHRMVQDLSSLANLIGFTDKADKPHIDAIQAGNARPIRKTELSWIIPRFVFADEPIKSRAREAILNFKDNLPYRYVEERTNRNIQDQLLKKALLFAELADSKNYQAYRTKESSDQVALVHVSPSAGSPENQAKVEEASLNLRHSSLWHWASKSLDQRVLEDTFTVEGAIVVARQADEAGLFALTGIENDQELLGMRRGAVAAVAAVVLSYRDQQTRQDIEWARSVVHRAMRMPETRTGFWTPSSKIPWHPGIYAAKGLAADLRAGLVDTETVLNLLALVSHPLEVVALAALEEACSLSSRNPRLTWAAVWLALLLCHSSPWTRNVFGDASKAGGELPTPDVQLSVESALSLYLADEGWAPLAIPPAAWIKVDKTSSLDTIPEGVGWGDEGEEDSEYWIEPREDWDSSFAGEVLKRVPIEDVLNTDANVEMLAFLEAALTWTNQKHSPPWKSDGGRNESSTRLFGWTRILGGVIGRVSGLLPLGSYRARFLDPILALPADNCWPLLSPFTRDYVCRYIFDAKAVPPDAVATLELCLNRLLMDGALERGRHHSGKFYGFDQPDLVRTLMFVSVERADLAARYANGDWSEITLILPIVDRFVRAGGWASSVMSPYLTLCERAKDKYPSKDFTAQVLAILSTGLDDLTDWHGTTIPARIAELVQCFSNRDSPMSPGDAQGFLRILDHLVDMGDRRSAALQLSEAFREVRSHS